MSEIDGRSGRYNRSKSKAYKRILAFGSKGGHWDQLMLLRPAFEGAEVLYVTTDGKLANAYGLADCVEVNDYSRQRPIAAFKGMFETLFVTFRYKPDVIITTGAAPGLFFIAWGRLLGSHTIWIDSIANAEEISLSGKFAKKLAHRTATQWKHLKNSSQLQYWGSVF